VRFTFVPGIGITHIFGESLFPRGNSNHRELDARLVEVHLNTKVAFLFLISAVRRLITPWFKVAAMYGFAKGSGDLKDMVSQW
jgi:hypothetical protein